MHDAAPSAFLATALVSLALLIRAASTVLAEPER